jgi:hypothetical protein
MTGFTVYDESILDSRLSRITDQDMSGGNLWVLPKGVSFSNEESFRVEETVGTVSEWFLFLSLSHRIR